MKNIVVILFALLFSSQIHAQDSASVIAKNFIKEGDYHNAILVLNRAIDADQSNIELKKDLAFSYYLSRDYVKALATIKSVNEGDSPDVQSFQIQGMVYKAIEERKEAEKMYRTALRKFPKSGALYSEYGEILWAKGDITDAAKQWERGIEVDVNYPGNYYNAAKYYYMSSDKVWGLLYGEIFVNLESYSKRTPEIKKLLLDGYKKLFTDVNISKGQGKNEFTKAVIDIMSKNAKAVNGGVTPDALSALRTRFTLGWFEKYATKFPYRLFDHYKQLAQEGMFDAYNQWIFGAADNLPAFQQWTIKHAEEYNKFVAFQKSRVFKLPQGQYYRK
ncbi:MAG: tetratricopeptide repeat protein [Chitinophagaceae bacterium]|nr:tetratricopeptide repeat protein [Chitinophagaceae bacterium]